MNSSFDILDYLNDMYMAKIAPDLNIEKVRSVNDTKEKNKEDKLQNNKKRIHIPNAQIEYFSNRYDEDVEEYNESDTSNPEDKSTRRGDNAVSDETSETTDKKTEDTTETIEI